MLEPKQMTVARPQMGLKAENNLDDLQKDQGVKS